MRLTRLSSIAAALTLTAGAGLFMIASPQTIARQDGMDGNQKNTFKVDGTHSMIMFRIKHMGVAYTYGMLHNPSGSYYINPDSPEECFLDVSVRVDEINTGNDKRDNHLRSPDFFNIKQYPTINVTADEFEKTGSNTLKTTGQLTLHGETNPVDIEITFHGEGKTPQGHKSGFEAEFTIQRTNFGMDTYVEQGALGDEVNIKVTIEGAKR